MEQKIKTLLVDDEAPARERLRRLLNNIQSPVEIVGESENGLQALEFIETNKPDLVFLDIQMPGLDGFELINRLKTVPQIIFCTAFEEYAVKAFDANGVDYLVKPVRQERLIQAIQKLTLKNTPKTSSQEVLEVVRKMLQVNQAPPLTSLPVKIGDKVFFVALSEILAFEAEDKYVNVITRKGKTHLTDLSLKHLEERLPDHFVRVQRALIVNRLNIQEVRKHLNNRFILIMNDERQTRFTTGRSFVEVVKGLWQV
jgi:two-component system LytT family response regulator